MKLKELEELIDFIAKSGLEEVNIETEEIKLSIKRNLVILQDSNLGKLPTALPVSSASHAALTTSQSTSNSENQSMAAADTSASTGMITIKSPMIGTFYCSSKPENPAFVQEGDTVAPGKVICIIEAMKLFNEIEAEVTGTIVKVLVEDASPVEYDQPLFLIKPA